MSGAANSRAELKKPNLSRTNLDIAYSFYLRVVAYGASGVDVPAEIDGLLGDYARALAAAHASPAQRDAFEAITRAALGIPKRAKKASAEGGSAPPV